MTTIGQDGGRGPAKQENQKREGGKGEEGASNEALSCPRETTPWAAAHEQTTAHEIAPALQLGPAPAATQSKQQVQANKPKQTTQGQNKNK